MPADHVLTKESLPVEVMLLIKVFRYSFSLFCLLINAHGSYLDD